MKKIVSNEEFEQAKQKYDYFLKFLLARYTLLEPEMREACGDVALWKCLRLHDPSFGTKFTTSLHKFVYWECLSETRQNTKHAHNQKLQTNHSVPAEVHISEYLDVLKPRERSMVIERFFYNYSFREIGEKHGVSHQRAHAIVKRALTNMAA